jgi:hypothetical protein
MICSDYVLKIILERQSFVSGSPSDVLLRTHFLCFSYCRHYSLMSAPRTSELQFARRRQNTWNHFVTTQTPNVNKCAGQARNEMHKYFCNFHSDAIRAGVKYGQGRVTACHDDRTRNTGLHCHSQLPHLWADWGLETWQNRKHVRCCWLLALNNSTRHIIHPSTVKNLCNVNTLHQSQTHQGHRQITGQYDHSIQCYDLPLSHCCRSW